MNYDFRLQYDPADIPDLAAKYLGTPYKQWTAADEDRVMEHAGGRLGSGVFNVADVRTIVQWKSHRKLSLFDENDPEAVVSAVRFSSNRGKHT